MNPVIAEVHRGPIVESRHTGAWAVADAEGRILASAGDIDRPIFPRSAVKALQALPLVASGAADRAGYTPPELALACASHDGSITHVQTARAMLRKLGHDATVLACGVHWPTSREAANALAEAGQTPTPLHNNCSGKHAGFVALAAARSLDTGNYVDPRHPVMREVSAALAEVLGVRLEDAPQGIDGCAIPAYAVPLRALAAGFARFGTGQFLPRDFAQAAAVLRRAVAKHPMMVAGAGRFDTEIASALGEAAFVKVGAEGVQCGALPGLGLGFAIKCDDGAMRASEAACAALLRRYLGAGLVLDRLASPPLTNWSGRHVGSVRGLIQ